MIKTAGKSEATANNIFKEKTLRKEARSWVCGYRALGEAQSSPELRGVDGKGS
jgi:hypothetical protein